MSCNDINLATRRDGLISIDSPASTPAEGLYAALVVGPGIDFHWYRRDDNGFWSHKPGETPVINVVQAGKRISDSKTASRGVYTNLCGYYHLITFKIRIL